MNRTLHGFDSACARSTTPRYWGDDDAVDWLGRSSARTSWSTAAARWRCSTVSPNAGRWRCTASRSTSAAATRSTTTTCARCPAREARAARDRLRPPVLELPPRRAAARPAAAAADRRGRAPRRRALAWCRTRRHAPRAGERVQLPALRRRRNGRSCVPLRDAAESGCALLLDVNNVYVNAHNHGFDAFAFLDTSCARRSRRSTWPGNSVDALGSGLLIDTHDAPGAKACGRCTRTRCAASARCRA